ncbi:nuclear transport factor 2 family protein [Micromonospora sp. NPDC093277]|uniref:nuclear transport factor 2 family protein n=1 Tax=Micromonospora sp. NPDC093277 TaxID=3364291 RepID=UPI0037FFE8D8
MDLREYLARYPHDVAFGEEDPEAVFDRYHAPGFVLYNDGVVLDRERLLAHVRPARKRAVSVHTEIHDALIAGDRVAARYTLTAVMRRGDSITTEIFLFGELAQDGRLQRLDQLTRAA